MSKQTLKHTAMGSVRGGASPGWISCWQSLPRAPAKSWPAWPRPSRRALAPPRRWHHPKHGHSTWGAAQPSSHLGQGRSGSSGSMVTCRENLPAILRKEMFAKGFQNNSPSNVTNTFVSTAGLCQLSKNVQRARVGIPLFSNKKADHFWNASPDLRPRKWDVQAYLEWMLTTMLSTLLGKRNSTGYNWNPSLLCLHYSRNSLNKVTHTNSYW